jgi:hypothetical protein
MPNRLAEAGPASGRDGLLSWKRNDEGVGYHSSIAETTGTVDLEKTEQYLRAARLYYAATDTAGITDPPLIIATPRGVRIMTWIPDNGDLTAAEVDEPRVVRHSQHGPVIRAWLLVEDEDLWD